MKNKLFIFFCLIFFGSSIFAQNQLVHEKKIFTDENGKVYLNKALPVYFKVSSSRSPNSEKFLLESKESPQYTNPMYFANEGLNTVYSPSCVDTTTLKVIVPQQNVYFQIYVDGTPPVSTIHNNSTPYIKSDTLYFGLNVKIKFDVTDKISGVEKTFYSLDGSDFKEYNGEALTFDKEKEYKLKYYSVDNVGNVEKINEIKFTIDGTKPMTNLQIFGDFIDNVISGTASISLKPKDAFAGTSNTYYILDNNEKQIYTKPISAKILSEGQHTLTYYTVDNVFNEEEEQEYVFFVDKTAPIIFSEIIGDSFFGTDGREYSSGRSKLKLTAIDNRAGVNGIYYTVNGSSYELYERPFYLPSTAGTLKIDFYAVDNVKNKTIADTKSSFNKMSFSSYIDLAGPELSYKYDGKSLKYNDTTYISNKTKIILSGTDKESGMQKITYYLNQKEELDYNGNLTVSGNGVNSIDFYGYDNVNNTNFSSFTFIVDEVGPEIYSQFSVKSLGKKTIGADEYQIFPNHVKLFISAFDNMVGVEKIYYTLNNEIEKLYTTYFTTFAKNTDNKLKIRTIDYLGNETVSNLYFSISN